MMWFIDTIAAINDHLWKTSSTYKDLNEELSKYNRLLVLSDSDFEDFKDKILAITITTFGSSLHDIKLYQHQGYSSYHNLELKGKSASGRYYPLFSVTCYKIIKQFYNNAVHDQRNKRTQ